ncbi:MAG: iron chelate uptake ABC transporter family permease subunit [Pseudomonadota bacterium]
MSEQALPMPLKGPRSHRLIVLAVSFFTVCMLFMTWNTSASWEFILHFRGKKLLTLVAVGAAIGIATLLFQTACQNRILTPGIMGFDAMYLLLQSSFMFLLGSFGFASMDPIFKWSIQTTAMTFSMLLLFKIVFRGSTASIHLLMLTGVVLGLGLTSLNGLLLRIMDPTQMAVIQDAFFASFSATTTELLWLAFIGLFICMGVLFRIHHKLDVLLLGEWHTNNLGVDYKSLVNMLLVLVTVLVAVSTATVGPVTFLGLIVVHLTYRLAGSFRHKITIPFAALMGATILIVGEWALQHVFAFQTRLSVVIEFMGGLLFLLLIFRQGRKCST